MNATSVAPAKKILVIDDDPLHLAVTRDLLEAEGYAVVIHETAFGATDRVRVEQPDLVLVDMNMPALSGEGLLHVLRGRERTRHTRVALYSSNDEYLLRETAERVRATGFICKGDPDGLRKGVARLLATG